MTDVHPKAAERQAYEEKFGYLVDQAIDQMNYKTRALVFRHTIGWMGEDEHLEAAFADVQRARDFCSMMENPSERWTVVTVYPDVNNRGLSSAMSISKGEVEVFEGGKTIKRVML